METAGLHLCSFLPSLSRLNKSLHPGFWVGKQEKELFDGKGLEAAVGSMGKRHVKLKLPRFKAEYGIKSLKETMQVGAGWQQEGGREELVRCSQQVNQAISLALPSSGGPCLCCPRFGSACFRPTQRPAADDGTVGNGGVSGVWAWRARWAHD